MVCPECAICGNEAIKIDQAEAAETDVLPCKFCGYPGRMVLGEDPYGNYYIWIEEDGISEAAQKWEARYPALAAILDREGHLGELAHRLGADDEESLISLFASWEG